MAERDDSVKIVTSGSVLGVAVGTVVTIVIKSIDPQTPATALWLTAVPTITLLIDRSVQKFVQWRGRVSNIAGIDEALSTTVGFLQNPANDDHKQQLLDRMRELQMKRIDAALYNPPQQQ